MTAPERTPSVWSRLAWFAALYVASICAFAALLYALRALLAR